MSQLEAFNLAMYFRSEFLRYDKRIFTATSLKSGKWWKYFEETIDKFSGREDWNPAIFVKCQFECFGKIYPSQLTSERAWETFKAYKFRFDETIDKQTQIVENVLKGYKAVKSFCINKKIPFSVSEFLKDNFNNRQLEIGAYPIHFFVFSQSYINIYGGNEIKRMVVAQNYKLMEKIREVLKDDFV